MNDDQQRGWVDTGTRVLRVLLRSERFKTNLRIVLRNLDPGAAPELVRTALFAEPQVSLSLLGAAPEVLNTSLSILRELADQLSRLPPLLVRETLSELAGRVRTKLLGQAVELLLGMVEQHLKQDPDAGKSTAELAKEIRRLLKQHPLVVQRIILPLAAPFQEVLDRKKSKALLNDPRISKSSSKSGKKKNGPRISGIKTTKKGVRRGK